MMNNSNFISNKHVNFKNFEESTMAKARYKVSKIVINLTRDIYCEITNS